MSSESSDARRQKPLRRDPASGARKLLPWAVAGVLALGAAWLGARHLALRGELALLRDQNALLEIALESAQQQLEAERIITRRLLKDAPTPISSKNENASQSGESQTAPR